MASTTSRPPALRRNRPRSFAGDLPKKVWMSAALWLMVAVYVIPALWFLLSSFKPAGELFSYPLTIFPKHPSLYGFTTALTSFDFVRYFLNTLIVAVSATLLTLVTSVTSGYALAKYKSWWLK